MLKIKTNDAALMKFSYEPLKQAHFRDKPIPAHDGAYEIRIEERGEIIKIRQETEREHIMQNDSRYKTEDNFKDGNLQ